MKGYPTPNTSVIEISLRNITFSGLRNTPHFIVQDVNSIEFSDVYVQVWQQWNTTSEEERNGDSGAQSLGVSSLAMFLVSIISATFVSLY